MPRGVGDAVVVALTNASIAVGGVAILLDRTGLFIGSVAALVVMCTIAFRRTVKAAEE